jgi:hypothetical protein
MGIECLRAAHSSSSAIFYVTLPAFANSLLGDVSTSHRTVGPAQRWPEIQDEMRSVIKELEDAEAVLEMVVEVDAELRMPIWLELRKYLIMKREALMALADVPLPPDAQKCGNDLLELCRVMDLWSQQRIDLIHALRAVDGEPLIEDSYSHNGRWRGRRFWSRLRQRRSARAWFSH